MDRFGPTGKVSKKKKLVNLLRWTTFHGRTGRNFGWMDRAHYNSETFWSLLVSDAIERNLKNGVYSKFTDNWYL